MAARKRKAQIDHDVALYLATGDSDPLGQVGAGNIVERLSAYHDRLVEALLAEVKRRERGHRLPSPPDLDLPSFARTRLSPMVKGLFPGAEREIVLGVLENSIVFLTTHTVRQVIRKVSFLSTAWQVANMYLYSLGAKTLSGKDTYAVGKSEDTTCFVSMRYFEEDDPFADYVVHEAAHVFHNTKRRTVGLSHTRYREWMLPIDFHKRETFAYACEVYICIPDRSRGPAQRRKLLAEYAKGPPPPDKRVAPEEFLDILEEAVGARNGWKRILRRCSRPIRRRGDKTVLPGPGSSSVTGGADRGSRAALRKRVESGSI